VGRRIRSSCPADAGSAYLKEEKTTMTITDTTRPPANAAGLAPGRLFIDGEWREASTVERREVINPSNDQVITSVAWAGPEDVDAAVEAARRSFESGV